MAFDRLYFYGTCLACRGSAKTWYDRECPYCYRGMNYHEVTDNAVKEYVMESMEENTKKELFIELTDYFNKSEGE